MKTLEQAALDCAKKITQDEIIQQYLQGVFKMGAEWQKEQSKFTDIHTDNSAVIERLQNELDRYRWHDLSADKDDLPNKDCVVIVAVPFPEDSNLSNMEEYAIADYDSNTKEFECDYFELNEDRDFKWKYIE